MLVGHCLAIPPAPPRQCSQRSRARAPTKQCRGRLPPQPGRYRAHAISHAPRTKKQPWLALVRHRWHAESRRLGRLRGVALCDHLAHDLMTYPLHSRPGRTIGQRRQLTGLIDIGEVAMSACRECTPRTECILNARPNLHVNRRPVKTHERQQS